MSEDVAAEVAEKKYHVIELNLPAGPGDEVPIPGKPPVVIDGHPFEFVSSISLGCDCERLTEVKVTFLAEVHGQAHVRQTQEYPAPDIYREVAQSLQADAAIDQGLGAVLQRALDREASRRPRRAKAVADFTQSFDARDWARAFIELVRRNPEIAFDEGTMIGWFANAIMRGYDTGYSKADADITSSADDEDPMAINRDIPEGIRRQFGVDIESLAGHVAAVHPADPWPTRTTPRGEGVRPPTHAVHVLVKHPRMIPLYDPVTQPLDYTRLYEEIPPHLNKPDAELCESDINQRGACAHELELMAARKSEGLELASDNVPFDKDGPAIVYNRESVDDARRRASNLEPDNGC